jgi:DNA-binding LacI/PurR family transcriptional regulator
MVAQVGRATIHDVARLAGVSATTVSHAFSGKGSVAPETRRRVRDAAHQLGYRPDVIVQSPRSNRLGVIALVVRPLDDLRPDLISGVDYFLRFTGAAALAAVSAGFGLMLVSDPTRPGATGTMLASDGFLVTEPVVDDPLVALLAGSGIPYVTVGEIPNGGPQQPSIDIETARLTQLALDHLVTAGATRVAIVVGTEPNEWNLRSVAEYRRWARHRDQEPLVVARRESMGERGGRSAARSLLGLADPPDGYYCLTGPHAVGLLAQALDHGLRVPDDLRVLAGSDCEQARAASPAISSIDLEPEALARRATALLLARMRGEPDPASPPGIGRLVARKTTL